MLNPSFHVPIPIPTSPASTVLRSGYHGSSPDPSTPFRSFREQAFQSSSAPSLCVLHPSAVEVLQRVEAQSTVDVESYVRALGDTKYASVKESRRGALLERERSSAAGAELDDVTIRRVTNLASAEASRAKKEFIMDELRSQLKKKSEDAIVLASELRKTVAIFHQVSNVNRQLEFQMAQQQYTYAPMLHQARVHMNEQKTGSTGNFGVTTETAVPKVWSDPQRELGQNLMNAIPGPIQIQQGHDQSDYSSVMDEDTMQNGCPPTPATMVTTVTDCDFSPSQQSIGGSLHDFAMEDTAKMETLMCSRAMTTPYGTDDTKAGSFGGGILPMHPDIADSLQFSVSNPSDQFTVAG